MKVSIRKPYTVKRVHTDIVGESMVKQSFKDESDVNLIIRKYKKTGIITSASSRIGQYYDAAEMSYQDAMDFITSTQQEFEQLPAEIRKRFGNDPQNMVEFIQDEGNREEAIKLGMIEPPPVDPSPKQNVPAKHVNVKETTPSPESPSDAA